MEEKKETSENKPTFRDKFLKGKGLFQYLRSVIVSQISGWTDIGMSQLAFAVLDLPAWIAGAIGPVCGGIVNCSINYKFTFRVDNGNVRNIVIKYFMVWIVSLTLNSQGTRLANEVLAGWLSAFGIDRDLCFFIARVSVSLLVSVCWNFFMQKYFVYRDVPFDRSLNHLLGSPHKK